MITTAEYIKPRATRHTPTPWTAGGPRSDAYTPSPVLYCAGQVSMAGGRLLIL